MKKLSNATVVLFKQSIKDINKNKIDIARYSYILYNENKDEFGKLCEKLDLSVSSVRKYIKAGEVIALSDVDLPETYSCIYELHPILFNLKDFEKFTGKKVKYMKRQEIRDEIKKYNNVSDIDEIIEANVEKHINRINYENSMKDCLKESCTEISDFLAKLDFTEEVEKAMSNLNKIICFLKGEVDYVNDEN